MHEFTVPLSWEQLDSLAEFLDIQLIEWGLPTILRLRTQMVLEEFFSSLMAAQSGRRGRLRCTFPALNTVCLQYGGEAGAKAPNLQSLRDLLGKTCTYGLQAQLHDSACTIRIGRI